MSETKASSASAGFGCSATPAVHAASQAFDRLIEARKSWINEILMPWCRTAPRLALLRAAQEWTDIAGKVDPDATLWLWAWSRFEGLCADGLTRLNETHAVEVMTRSGDRFVGFPDARESQRGQLVLADQSGYLPPLSIDDIVSVTRVDAGR